MITIVILGAGNVATHLCTALEASSSAKVLQLYSRSSVSKGNFPKDVEIISSLSNLREADVYIIAIPDDAIASFSEVLPCKNKLVVHTSGSVPMLALSEYNRRGVFYMLQTFSKESKVLFSEIPICLETEVAVDMKTLETLARSLSNTVVEISSEERARIHLSAVFVNNFVNHIYRIGSDILKTQNIPFHLLEPLIQETARKIKVLSPEAAQTGPAKRNDKKTIEKHLHLLQDSPYQELYAQLTKAIQDVYGKEL